MPIGHSVSKPDAGHKQGRRLRGRKFYWHHPHWSKPTGIPKKSKFNRTVRDPILPDAEFVFDISFRNLSDAELGGLLWLLSLNDGDKEPRYFYRLGYGKPLGYGSVTLKLDGKGTLPFARGKDWSDYYGSLAAAPPETGRDIVRELIGTFRAAVEAATGQGFDELPFVREFLRVAAGPNNDAPIRYPYFVGRDKGSEYNGDRPHPDGKNYGWFVENERKNSGGRHPLPRTCDEDTTLPNDPRTGGGGASGGDWSRGPRHKKGRRR